MSSSQLLLHLLTAASTCRKHIHNDAFAMFSKTEQAALIFFAPKKLYFYSTCLHRICFYYILHEQEVTVFEKWVTQSSQTNRHRSILIIELQDRNNDTNTTQTQTFSLFPLLMYINHPSRSWFR
jgi:hypothetical protein